MPLMNELRGLILTNLEIPTDMQHLGWHGMVSQGKGHIVVIFVRALFFFFPIGIRFCLQES